LPDKNVDPLVKLFKKKGISGEDIMRIFNKFAGTSKNFQKLGELI